MNIPDSVTTTNGTGSAAFLVNNAKAVLTLTGGGQIKHTNYYGVRVASGKAVIKMDGGKVSGKLRGAYVDNGDLSVESGEIRSEDGYGIQLSSKNQGRLIVSDSGKIYGKAGIVSTSAGSIIEIKGSAVVQGETNGIIVHNGKLTVNGGVVEAAANGSVLAIEAHAAVVGVTDGTIRALGEVIHDNEGNPHAPTAIGLFNDPYNNDSNTTPSGLSITGGTVEATGFAVSGNNQRSAGTTVSISGNAKLESKQFGAIYWPMEGTLNISGDAEIAGGTGIEAKMGTINISGGTITGNGEHKDQPPMNGGNAPEGSALLFSTQMYGHVDTNTQGTYGKQFKDSPELNLTITGGKFVSENGNGITVYNTKTNSVPAKINISGETTEVTGNAAMAALVVKTAETAQDNVTTVAASGGYYSSDVAAHCATGFASHPVSTSINNRTGCFNVHAPNQNGVKYDENGHWWSCAGHADCMIEAEASAHVCLTPSARGEPSPRLRLACRVWSAMSAPCAAAGRTGRSRPCRAAALPAAVAAERAVPAPAVG